MRIVIANDHGAVALKHELVAFLRAGGHEVANLGVDTEDRVDYPDKAREACREFLAGGYDFGVVLCGTGIGISIAANKVDGIRCALVHDTFTARLAREHNDANFVAMGGRVRYAEKPTEILSAFMSATFEGGRHRGRLDKIAELER